MHHSSITVDRFRHLKTHGMHGSLSLLLFPLESNQQTKLDNEVNGILSLLKTIG